MIIPDQLALGFDPKSILMAIRPVLNKGSSGRSNVDSIYWFSGPSGLKLMTKVDFGILLFSNQLFVNWDTVWLIGLLVVLWEVQWWVCVTHMHKCVLCRLLCQIHVLSYNKKIQSEGPPGLNRKDWKLWEHSKVSVVDNYYIYNTTFLKQQNNKNRDTQHNSSCVYYYPAKFTILYYSNLLYYLAAN